EATAGVARAYIEHNLGASPTAQKFFYLGPMFRHERPQAGRLRQFHQYGVESFGSVAPEADAEVISLLWQFLSSLGLPDLTLEINSLGDAADRTAYKTVLLDFLKKRINELCGNCQRRITTNPLRVLDCKVPGCRTVTADGPKLIDSLSPESYHKFQKVLDCLKALKIPYEPNSRLVRGLDYYTFTTFEVTTTHLGAQNAVGAGGRYDGLVEALGGPKTPAIGFAVGLERVSLMLPGSSLPSQPKVVYVAGFGQSGTPTGMKVLHELRSLRIPSDSDYRVTTLKAHLRQADRLGAAFVLIIGDDEVEKGQVILRNMTSKEQQDLPLSTAAQSVASHLPSV
ncbi:MAG: histidine--tRNA ligase, partial [Nitrospirae bacterium]|nr:histidine--tRNA ligase [Nitrospirota bacterium]